MVTFYAYTLTA